MDAKSAFLENTKVCSYTGKRFPKSQMIQILDKLSGKRLWLSPEPAFKYINKAIKDSKIDKRVLQKTGDWQMGVREVDLKSYFEKWNKKQLQNK